MLIIPAIDILGGLCVRLTRGNFKTATVYCASPLAVAKKFEEQGAKMLHVVDLDAAKTGEMANQKLVFKIAKTIGIPLQVGGGIRDIDTARKYLQAGIQRIVIGTKALTEPELVSSLIKEFGSERIVVALEIKNGKIAVKGWQETLDKNYVDFAKELKALGVSQILFTDVERDGTLTEPNFDAIAELIALGLKIIASGGVAGLESLERLNQLNVFGTVIGKALYERKFNLGKVKKDYNCNFFSLFEPTPVSNLTKRIIPCLDVRDGKVVKGVRFKDHVVMGDVVELARRYSEEGADELVFYDITASTQARTVSVDWVKRVAKVINIPFCVAGGISSINDARRILQSGADKISINSPALEDPPLISKLAKEFGSQCVVVGIDSFEKDGQYFVKQYTGDPSKTKLTKWQTLAWAKEAQKRGAGEIVMNSMNQDGVRKGYDIKQLQTLSSALNIPVIASGGAGSIEDFLDLFRSTDADGALAASVFHSGEIAIPELKKYLSVNNIVIRL